MDAAKVAFPELEKVWQLYQHGEALSFMKRGLVSAKGWPRYIFMPADLKALLEAQKGAKFKRIKAYSEKK